MTFSCSVVGNPTPSVVLTKEGKYLNVTANSRFNLSSRSNNHSLEIAEVHRSDSGQYRCVVKNSKNISYSSAATLTVQCEGSCIAVTCNILLNCFVACIDCMP